MKSISPAVDHFLKVLILFLIISACSSKKELAEEAVIESPLKDSQKWVVLFPDSLHVDEYEQKNIDFGSNSHPNYLFDQDSSTYWNVPEGMSRLKLHFDGTPRVSSLKINCQFLLPENEKVSDNSIGIIVAVNEGLPREFKATSASEQVIELPLEESVNLKDLVSFKRGEKEGNSPLLLSQFNISALTDKGLNEEKLIQNQGRFTSWALRQDFLAKYFRDPELQLKGDKKIHHSRIYDEWQHSNYETIEQDKAMQKKLPMYVLEHNADGLLSLFNNLLAADQLKIIKDNFDSLSILRTYPDSGYVFKQLPKPSFDEIMFKSEEIRVVFTRSLILHDRLLKKGSEKFLYQKKEQPAYFFYLFPLKIIKRSDGIIRKAYIRGYNFQADFHDDPHFYSDLVLNYNENGFLTILTAFYDNKQLQFISITYGENMKVQKLESFQVIFQDDEPEPALAYRVDQYLLK